MNTRTTSCDKTDSCAKYPRNFIGLIWSAIGMAAAMGLVLWLIGDDRPEFLLASFASSSIFLFVLTETEAAQPRALFGGHLGGALIGILCYQLFGDALWVFAVALGLSIALMMITRTIHPPGGFNALFMVQHHAGFFALLKPVGLGVLALFLVTIVWSHMRPGKRYPMKWW